MKKQYPVVVEYSHCSFLWVSSHLRTVCDNEAYLLEHTTYILNGRLELLEGFLQRIRDVTMCTWFVRSIGQILLSPVAHQQFSTIQKSAKGIYKVSDCEHSMVVRRTGGNRTDTGLIKNDRSSRPLALSFNEHWSKYCLVSLSSWILSSIDKDAAWVAQYCEYGPRWLAWMRQID